MKKEYIFIIVLVLLVVLIFVFSKLNNKVYVPPGNIKLQITDLREGTGEAAKVGDKLSVNYLGTLENGQQFDSSYGREPLKFTLGQGQVLFGWDQGLVGMKVGGKRKLIVPPDLGYGSVVRNSVPPNSVLNFEIELLEIIK
ncbi:MAG: FKBP-type peptidyl-prolyl cis-trans isomerase [Candidatus Parcubacteria bacterium]|nr:FKBP-type peptidyl-prolyl cis-trans isomerase [Candidatus Parcubacteria bacterium]